MIPSKILIVEDELHHGEQLKRVLEGRGHTVLGPAPDCSAALELIWRERPDIAFVDTHLGSETCEVVLEECDLQDVPVIITSSDIHGLPGSAEGATGSSSRWTALLWARPSPEYRLDLRCRCRARSSPAHH